jgi:hypothetical protein
MRQLGIDVALERAAKQGRTRGLDVDWRHVDRLADPPKPDSYDLGSAHYMQLLAAERRRLYGHLAATIPATCIPAWAVRTCPT